MHTIGLIGGMSWESSSHYYRIINQAVAARLGGLHSARTLMLSVNFDGVAALQRAGDWAALATMMAEAARALEAGGAGCVVICTNTMHKLAEEVTAAVTIPLLHIADATAMAIAAAGARRVGLIGTAFTMEQDFYRGRLADRHGLEVLVPGADDRATVHRMIYDELVRGRVLAGSRLALVEVIERLVARGAEGVILGCTELMLAVGPADASVPLFDTTELHALAAVEWALG